MMENQWGLTGNLLAKNQERQLLADMSLLPKRLTVFNSAIIICSL